MEQKKGEVKKTAFYKEVDLEHGKFYSHIVEMENGDKGSYLSKNKDQKKFVEGQEVEYTFEDKGDPKYNKIKPVPKKPQASSSYGKPQRTKQEEIEINKEKSKAFAWADIIKAQVSMPAYAARYTADMIKDKGGEETKNYKELYKQVYDSMKESMNEIKKELADKF
jgi:hypothetical protein